VSKAIAKLIETVPDLANADPLSAEVQAWLDQAYRTLWGIRSGEARVLKSHAQQLYFPATRKTASKEIVETLRRVDRKISGRSPK